MRKTKKALHLHRETLRTLTSGNLSVAAGGGPFQQSENCTGDCETNQVQCLNPTQGITRVTFQAPC